MSTTASIKNAIAEERRLRHSKQMSLLGARIGALQKVSFALDTLKASLKDKETVAGASKVAADTVALRKCTAKLGSLLRK